MKKTSKIIKWILLLWITVLLGTIVMCLFLYKNTTGYISYAVEELIKQSSTNISNKINDKLTMLEHTSKTLSDDLIDNVKLSVDYLSTIREEQGFRNLSVASIDGTTYTSNGNVINLYDTDYFQKALAGERNVGNLVSSKDNGEAVNVYCVPIYRGNEVVGVLWGSIGADNLYNELELTDISRYGDVLIVDSHTNFIVGEKNLIRDTKFYDYVAQHEEQDF